MDRTALGTHFLVVLLRLRPFSSRLRAHANGMPTICQRFVLITLGSEIFRGLKLMEGVVAAVLRRIRIYILETCPWICTDVNQFPLSRGKQLCIRPCRRKTPQHGWKRWEIFWSIHRWRTRGTPKKMKKMRKEREKRRKCWWRRGRKIKVPPSFHCRRCSRF